MEKPQESPEAAEAPTKTEEAPNRLTKTLKVIGFTLLGAAVAIPAICLYLGKRLLKGQDRHAVQDREPEPERAKPVHIPISTAPSRATEEESASVPAPPEEEKQEAERPQPTLVASIERDKFHRVGCRWAQNIREDHRVTFEDREEAIAQGYTPCSTCNP
ncbi:MAG: hypothetical protein ACP5HG_13950 [Anaerolineae bacterium]